VNETVLAGTVRRRQVLAVGMVLPALMLADCGSTEHDAVGWRFVDDRNKTVSLRRRPTRIVAYSSAAAALYQWGVTPVGVFGDNPVEDPALRGYPWTESELIGSVYGEIDVTKLREVNADLIVSRWYPTPGSSIVFGFKDLDQQKAIDALVPIVAINGNVIATGQIDRFADLVRALGVDTGSHALSQARAEFGKAESRLSSVAGREANLRIIAVSGDQNTMYIAKVAHSGDLRFYIQLGVPIVSAKATDPYWDSVPWEHADKYPADGILYDARVVTLPLSTAKAIPSFAALPAVRANQVGSWRADPSPSYAAYTSVLKELATTIAGWRKVT
jgi:iron complex transport system substrate-binding protein